LVDCFKFHNFENNKIGIVITIITITPKNKKELLVLSIILKHIIWLIMKVL